MPGCGPTETTSSNVCCLKPPNVGSFLTQPEVTKTTGRISSVGSVSRRRGREVEGKAEAEAYRWGRLGSGGLGLREGEFGLGSQGGGSHRRSGAAWDGMSLGFGLAILVRALWGLSCRGESRTGAGGGLGLGPQKAPVPAALTLRLHSRFNICLTLQLPPDRPAPLPLLPVRENAIVFL